MTAPIFAKAVTGASIQARSQARLSDGIVLFGAGGDLAQRMLFPALAYLEAEGLLPPKLPIIGASRASFDAGGFGP